MNAGKSDLESLGFLPPKNPSAERLGKVIAFFDDILISMKAWHWFRERLPEHLRARTAIYNSRRGGNSKLDVTAQFCDDKTDILFASEAWIRYVVSGILFMVPASLSIWLQRAGRAVRKKDAQAHTYLLVQPRVFQEKNKKKREEGDEIEDVADEHLNNPVNCQASSNLAMDEAQSPESPSTRTSAVHNVKRGAVKRSDQHLEEARRLLRRWRASTYQANYERVDGEKEAAKKAKAEARKAETKRKREAKKRAKERDEDLSSSSSDEEALALVERAPKRPRVSRSHAMRSCPNLASASSFPFPRLQLHRLLTSSVGQTPPVLTSRTSSPPESATAVPRLTASSDRSSSASARPVSSLDGAAAAIGYTGIGGASVRTAAASNEPSQTAMAVPVNYHHCGLVFLWIRRNSTPILLSLSSAPASSSSHVISSVTGEPSAH
ncbi:uncharacterized protein STEHIDRAFT_163963 [Stereum hirsutum FP-91666 SS1]|uniref:Helicase C-terminal domain-containing protein n=1 Tax=Stereum hirsutum (strain FP-91666) TaxID=721885 RepID=R7RWH0_STEHR|nr:uncharacterized protein STEHIDRAFT_163963 [Stereum hirsutum FP-91666 SS1]EIM79140.1 hypothetical protein STEHIDRAFT_163963 [Stereum hirsutum FP-91666 SS1]